MHIFGIIINITFYHPRGVYLGLLMTNMVVSRYNFASNNLSLTSIVVHTLHQT